MPSKRSKSSVRVVNPQVSGPTLTKSMMPFSEVPATVYNGEPVRPKTVPASRQLAEGPNVKIIRGKGL